MDNTIEGSVWMLNRCGSHIWLTTNGLRVYKLDLSMVKTKPGSGKNKAKTSRQTDKAVYFKTGLGFSK